VDLDIGNTGFGVAIIFLGIFCIGLGVLGFCMAKCKGCISTTLFITFAGLFALILLILGALMGGFVGPKLFQKIKKHSCRQSGIVFDEYVAAIDKSVCSYECPCPKGANDANEDLWTGYGNDYVRQYNRTTSTSNMTTSELNQWNSYNDDADITPLVFKSNG